MTMKFNKKTVIFLISILLIVIATAFIYQKYQGFLPTPVQQQPLTRQQIEQIKINSPITEIRVYKSQRKAELMHHDQVIRNYTMRLGFTPEGHKQQEGDGKTPEGRYEIDWRNPNSAFYKSLHVSYPNQQDKSKANQLGVSPGGDIMIHGSATRSQVEKLPSLMTYLPRNDWTWGCIAVRNIDMDEIWKLVDDGTVISIYS